MKLLQLCALLMLASCEQTAGQALMPDEITLFGSQGVSNGEITRGSSDYATGADGYRYGAALTWDIGAPPESMAPHLERIARAVERGQPLHTTVFTGPVEPDRDEDTTNTRDAQPDDDLIFGMTMSRFAATLGATAAAIATVFAAIKQGQSSDTPTNEPE